MSAYVHHPFTEVKDAEKIKEGIEEIYQAVSRIFSKGDLLILDCYPGVDETILRKLAEMFEPDLLVNSRDIFKDRDALNEQLKYHLTEDRVFGRMYYGELMDLTENSRLAEARECIRQNGTRVIYGVGASLIGKGDVNIYFDISRWQLQLRFREGLDNFKAENYDEDNLRKFKRGYFIEWRLADKHKLKVFEDMDYYVDANDNEHFKAISARLFEKCLEQDLKQPFRCIPYFDASPWGGTWMQEHFDLPQKDTNYGWAFDGVPEENSLLFRINDKLLEMPAMNLTLMRPKQLLGAKVYARFGAEFPIRFDFLDTIKGGNLSLQVHPTSEFIKKNFGMAYTQDESYYILDATEDSCVFLGLKDDADEKEFFRDLEEASRTGSFDAEKYINRIPAKKHDHFLIPAGTLHCSGKDTLVLEISATPYIFTFKLWDWGRLGLDGKPRPVHIENGRKCVDPDRRTAFVCDQLINRFETVREDETHIEERTGLHELEFIETRRFTIHSQVTIENHQSVNMLNLVEGKECIIESVDGSFDPYIVHYAETFIIPETIRSYIVKTSGGQSIRLIQAYVRV